MNVAVLYCIFNRPDVVKKTFEAIKQAKPPRLYVFSDGPRANVAGEDSLVNMSREHVLNSIDWECELHTLFQEKNIGCDTAIPKAVEWFFQNEEMGIVLEDDILASQDFFNFCEILLNKYKDDPRVINIGGTCITKDVDYKYSYAFVPRPYTWGWAAWRRSWEGFDIKISDWKKLRKTNFLSQIFLNDIDKIIEWSEIFDIYYGNSAWDYAYSFSSFKKIKDGCCSILPLNKSLITNIGFYGYHYNDSNNSVLGWEIDSLDTSKMVYPSDVKLDNELLKKVYEAQSKRLIEKYSDLTMGRLIRLNLMFPVKYILTCVKLLFSIFNKEAFKRRRARIVRLKYNLIKNNRYYFLKNKSQK